MTSEEKAVVEAAKDWIDGVPEDSMRLVEAVQALKAAPTPMRRFWVNYHFTGRIGEGEGSCEIGCQVPITRAVLDYWAAAIARAGGRGDATIVVRTWTELEA